MVYLGSEMDIHIPGKRHCTHLLRSLREHLSFESPVVDSLLHQPKLESDVQLQSFSLNIGCNFTGG